MSCIHRLETYGKNKILNLRCSKCSESASFGNPVCFRSILEKIEVEDNINKIILNRNFKKVFDFNSVKILVELKKFILKFSEANLHLCSKCSKYLKNLENIKSDLYTDPLKAYNRIKEELENKNKCGECGEKYSNFIKDSFDAMDKLQLIKYAKEVNGRNVKTNEIYHIIFHEHIKPDFITSLVDYSIPENARVVESYMVDDSEIIIYENPERPDYVYHINAPEFELSNTELKILNEVMNEIGRKEDIEVDFLQPTKARTTFKKMGMKLLKEICEKNKIEIDGERMLTLNKIIVRYTAGYGLLEIPLNDEKIQDVYIDSPGDYPLYTYHQDYEDCMTNITLGEDDLEKLSTRFRGLSGRPFDESSPAFHSELSDIGIRVCGVRSPLTFNGTGFAFRKHSLQPWTLSKFIANNMISSETAGLLSFLVDSQCSILVTGSRGAGKTSVLMALISEIPQNSRAIVIEDTPEIPVEMMREKGYKIQHIRTSPFDDQKGYEVNATTALRNALRLGESVLVLGEVRGEEARALFEAMRIGAAGNCVFGTIHGSSPYDTWDRIVNDLKVPSTSFKATDIVVSVAGLRSGEDIKRSRRVTRITEIKKHWSLDPYVEKGFNDLMTYNTRTNKMEFNPTWYESEIFQNIAKAKGMTMTEIAKSIELRTKIKHSLVYYSQSRNRPEFLEVEFNAKSNNKLIELVRTQKKTSETINYEKLYDDWTNWIKSQLNENEL
ncbi:MAG: ATPase, T2SS/T4P/T4SS family [Candidatus Nanoarchaeia archaeon]|nr:ATPase, T2SS/T4P/T4SS family [Candidatus Nanoarchaeia archaeon]